MPRHRAVLSPRPILTATNPDEFELSGSDDRVRLVEEYFIWVTTDEIFREQWHIHWRPGLDDVFRASGVRIKYSDICERCTNQRTVEKAAFDYDASEDRSLSDMISWPSLGGEIVFHINLLYNISEKYWPPQLRTDLKTMNNIPEGAMEAMAKGLLIHRVIELDFYRPVDERKWFGVGMRTKSRRLYTQIINVKNWHSAFQEVEKGILRMIRLLKVRRNKGEVDYVGGHERDEQLQLLGRWLMATKEVQDQFWFW